MQDLSIMQKQFTMRMIAILQESIMHVRTTFMQKEATTYNL